MPNETTNSEKLPDSSTYDAIVIGGGPAGSTASTLLAQAGHRILQLERERFPRFKIGESLIPASFHTLERLGMIDQLRRSHFPKKHSVQFFSRNGKASAPFYFHETDPSERSQTWQVLRSEFDQAMLENARQHGVVVHEGVVVGEVLFEEDRAVGVRARFSGESAAREISARVVVDASGQRSILARQLGLRQSDPCLRMAAIFTHFEGAARDGGLDEGATLILDTENRDSWFWFIPLPQDRASVGVVGPISYLIQGRRGNPQRTFDEEVARCPGLQPRLTDAHQAMDVKVLNDFSYVSKRAAGDGWVLVGDAFGFLDPIYSTGVLLALRSGEYAADAINEALHNNDTSAAQLGDFDQRIREGMESFRKLVYAFYTKSFSFSSFLRRHPEHRLAIVDILIGDVFDRDFQDFFTDIDRVIAEGRNAA